MTLQEMHVAFRQYAQQMGMQNVRAILPEQIDLLLNTAITDTVNLIIKENIGVTNDRVITDNSKIGQINALRTLYRVEEIAFTNTTIHHNNNHAYKVSIDLGGTTIAINDVASDVATVQAFNPDYLFLVDFSLNYALSSNKYTRWFPVRLIDDAYLSDTLNDFILAPRFRSPIAVLYSKVATNGGVKSYIQNTLDLYFGEKSENIALDANVDLSLNKLRVSYVGKPQKVRYLTDVTSGANIECDLPDYMHDDIVRRAVDLYRVALNGSLYTSQQQEQAQQRENTRNNYRNEQQ